MLTSGEDRFRLVQAIELENEESLVAVAISLPLKHLDLVVDAFQLAGRDRVQEIVEDASGMQAQRLG